MIVGRRNDDFHVCVVGARRRYAKVNKIANRGSGVLHLCGVGGRRNYATCMGNSSRGEENEECQHWEATFGHNSILASQYR